MLESTSCSLAHFFRFCLWADIRFVVRGTKIIIQDKSITSHVKTLCIITTETHDKIQVFNIKWQKYNEVQVVNRQKSLFLLWLYIRMPNELIRKKLFIFQTQSKVLLLLWCLKCPNSGLIFFLKLQLKSVRENSFSPLNFRLFRASTQNIKVSNGP